MRQLRLPPIHQKGLLIIAGIGVGILLVTAGVLAFHTSSRHTQQVTTSKPKVTKPSEREKQQKELAIQTPAASNVAEETEHTTPTTESHPVTAPKIVQPAQTIPQQPAIPPFGVTYAYLDQPSVYCSGDGNYYIVSINDVNIGLSNDQGGQLSVGFDVTGGIPDDYSFETPLTIPSGGSFTSFNKIKRSWSNDPNPVYTQTVWSGHGAAGVRAVVRSPSNVTYSSWVTIPAQASGERCY